MRELKEIRVDFISLVKRPATGKSLLLKGEGGEAVHTFEFIKTQDELMRAYGIVYSPDTIDLQGDIANAQTIRKASDAFMMKGVQPVDVEHSFKPTPGAFVAESWLIRKGDPLFPEEKEGAWAVGVQITNPELWQQLKGGELTGFSMAGTATTVQKSEEIPGWFLNFLQQNNELMTRFQKEDAPAATIEAAAALTEADVRRIAKEVIEEYMKEKDKPAEAETTSSEEAAKSMSAIEAALVKAFGKTMDEKLAPLLKAGRSESGPGIQQHRGGYL